LVDFGLAKEVRLKPPYTDYVGTRWYRAPENLLKFTKYSSAIDIFALGCIMVELYIGKALWRGEDEIDQL
jgi:serine/threonine protein kinase